LPRVSKEYNSVVKPSKLLIANRGEIAIRVIRTAREMGLRTVAAYSEADRGARHVLMADEAYLLGPAPPAQSYLDAEKVLAVAARAGADAVHPGYGFFSENAEFARAVERAGLLWIGPNPGAIDAAGDKVRARAAMIAAGIPVVPGGARALESMDDVRAAAATYGFPLVLKASGGGGGKGLKVARTPDELASAFTTARREAQAYFKNATIYAERYLENPKHIEVQILADRHGTVLHVGERDCSLQRRRQKLLEETPPNISPALREAIRASGLAAARAISYDSVGTVEFLATDDAFYFLEMNTRIQVEHTVTEMVSGIDLIREQIRVAAGEKLGYGQERIACNGHAIEIRVNAEDPARDFAPAPGTITAYEQPSGPGVRVDSAAFAGCTIPPDYDSLIAKLIVWAPTRDQAVARLRRAIDEFTIRGVPTTLGFLRSLLDHPPVADATYGTATLEAFAATLAPADEEESFSSETASYAAQEIVRVEIDDRFYAVRLLDLPGTEGLRKPRARKKAPTENHAATSSDDISSPIHGVLAAIDALPGASVKAGQVIAVIEAMKMMNEIRAHRDGTVKSVHAEIGATVERHAVLISLAKNGQA
jgi:acetyl-CoA/propionyl-CoA carboxylase biotin carboxyl carrier protein